MDHEHHLAGHRAPGPDRGPLGLRIHTSLHTTLQVLPRPFRRRAREPPARHHCRMAHPAHVSQPPRHHGSPATRQEPALRPKRAARPRSRPSRASRGQPTGALRRHCCGAAAAPTPAVAMQGGLCERHAAWAQRWRGVTASAAATARNIGGQRPHARVRACGARTSLERPWWPVARGAAVQAASAAAASTQRVELR